MQTLFEGRAVHKDIIAVIIQGYSLKRTKLYLIIFQECKSRQLVKENSCNKEIKLQFRLVRRLDGTIPFHS